MPARPQDERRQGARVDLMTWCPTRIRVDGGDLRALMTNLSERGAGLRLEVEDRAPFAVGDELVLQVHTPYGESPCRGRVAWLEVTDGRARLGVEFTRLADTAKDPLRTLMASPF